MIVSVLRMIKAKCKGCGVILISESQHDFQQCKCSNKSFIDGGGDIGSRYGGVDMKLIRLVTDNDQMVENITTKCSKCGLKQMHCRCAKGI